MNDARQLPKIQLAIQWMEDHLTEPITPEQVAEAAGLSYFHFHKIFRTALGMSLSEYLRRRRVSESAKHLLAGAEIKWCAARYRLGSPQGFTRCFKELFALTPAQFRQARDTGPRLDRIEIDPRTLVDFNTLENTPPEILHLPRTHFLGFSHVGENDHSTHLRLHYKLVSLLPEIPHQSGAYCQVFGRTVVDPRGKEILHFFVGIQVDPGTPSTASLEPFVFEEGWYAVFHYRGTIRNLGQAFGYLYGVWPPTCGARIHPDRPHATAFESNFCSPENEVMRIYLPLETPPSSFAGNSG